MADQFPLPPGATAVTNADNQPFPLPPGATPAPAAAAAAPGILGVENAIADVGVGAVKGLGDTVSGLSHLINKIPVVGETLAPQAGIQALDTLDVSKNTAQDVGKGVEAAAEWLIPGLAEEGGAVRAAKLVSLAKKYPLLADTLNLATLHPWLSKMILEGSEGAAKGATIGAVKGAQQGQTIQGAKTGAEIGGATSVAVAAAPLLINPFRKAAGATWDAVSGTWKTATEGASRAISPTAAMQPEAQAALREGATASAADAGISAPAASPANAGVRTLMTQPIAAATKIEDSLYATVNKAAETDMKTLYDAREAIQEAIDDPLQVANRQSLQTELHTTQTKINWGEENVRTKLGTNASDLIRQSKAATQQRYAMELGDAKLFNNESVVKGNVAHGGAETIQVDSAIKQAELLDKPSKFAPRGSPTRLQQMFGVDGAKAFKQSLYDAQRAGHKVLTRNTILGALAGTATVGTTVWDLLAR